MSKNIISVPAETPQLFYEPYSNCMTDEAGVIVFDICRYVSPNMLYLFKEKQECMIVPGVAGGLVELIWPDDEFMIDAEEAYRNNWLHEEYLEFIKS